MAPSLCQEVQYEAMADRAYPPPGSRRTSCRRERLGECRHHSELGKSGEQPGNLRHSTVSRVCFLDDQYATIVSKTPCYFSSLGNDRSAVGLRACGRRAESAAAEQRIWRNGECRSS